MARRLCEGCRISSRLGPALVTHHISEPVQVSGDRDTGDGSNEGSQSWDERKDPHGLCFGRGSRETVSGRGKREGSRRGPREDVCHKPTLSRPPPGTFADLCRSAIYVSTFIAFTGVIVPEFKPRSVPSGTPVRISRPKAPF